MIFVRILGPFSGGWCCRISDFCDGTEGESCIGEPGATPAEAIAAATEELRDHLAQHQFTPRTAREVAISGLAYDDEMLVLIPIKPERPDPDFPKLTPEQWEEWSHMV